MGLETSVIESKVSEYYESKIIQYGASPKGVDWNDLDSQHLRFQILGRMIEEENCSINDLGCGDGELVDYLIGKQKTFTYFGADVSMQMLKKARSRFGTFRQCTFGHGMNSLPLSDYTLLSGVFNVRLNFNDETWLKYIIETLDHCHSISRRGFSFNLLTSYSDPDKRRPDLYYGDPCFFFDLCKRRYSKQVALFHDYRLFEFTISVKIVGEG